MIVSARLQFTRVPETTGERVCGVTPKILRRGFGARPRKKRFLLGPLAAGFGRVTEFVAANGDVIAPCLDRIAFHVYNHNQFDR
jgi:hypothetical protein